MSTDVYMNEKIGYREKNKSRCRNKVFESIYKSGKNDEESFNELCFYEQQYANLKMKDYIIKMMDIAISYTICSDLKPKERIIYVEGMDFAYDCIGKINEANRGILLNNDIKLEFINDELSRNLENKSIRLTKTEEELFKSGVLASCAINFNIVDTKNIISKVNVKK